MSKTSRVYRYTTEGEGVWSAGKRLLPDELVDEANKNRAWLKKPDISEGNYRFWMTELGKETYEQTLFKTHQKYLPDIKLEEMLRAELGDVVYEDKYQVVERLSK